MSKLQRLRDNIAAIECALKGGNDQEVLGKYTGFGGMNFILNPIDSKEKWSKSDLQYYDDTMRLHKMLINASKNADEMYGWVESLKSSVLTAYYTPGEVVAAIMDSIYGMKSSYYDKGICPKLMLDPAAGMGVFATAAMRSALGNGCSLAVTCYEKDILTATMLSADKWQKMSVRAEGFENFPDDYLGTYDLVSTNVPFGAISVYDPAYTKSGDAVTAASRRISSRATT